MEVDIYIALLQFAESFLSTAFFLFCFVFDRVPCSLLAFLPKCGDLDVVGRHTNLTLVLRHKTKQIIPYTHSFSFKFMMVVVIQCAIFNENASHRTNST